MKQWNGFRKGINLGGWLSQCDYSRERLENFIREDDLARIASWGADHVRLPIDYNVLEAENGWNEYGFDRVTTAVGWARKHGLNIVLDLHKTAGFMFDQAVGETGFFDDERLQERFYRLWEELARRFGGDPEHVAFELLNEVTEERFSPIWNRIARTCISRIRPIAPDTVILVGNYHNNSVQAVLALDAPYDDRVVYNFHCYDPLVFTHQHAYWVRHVDVSRDLTWEQSGATPAYFEALFADAIRRAEEMGTVLYCGEYGVIDRTAPEEALKWYRAIHTVFEKHHIGRCAWSYKEMDFGIADERMDGVREELVGVL